MIESRHLEARLNHAGSGSRVLPLEYIAVCAAAVFLACSTTAFAQSAPTDVVATAGDSQALITWSAVSGATGYNVYRSTSSGSGFTEINPAPQPPAGTAFIDTGLTDDTTYYYEVTSLVGSSESSDSDVVSVAPAQQSGHWVFSYSTLGGTTTSPAYTDNTLSLTTAGSGAYSAMAMAFGSASGTVSTTAESSGQGQWTAAWMPSPAGSWPSLFVVNHTVMFRATASVMGISGTGASGCASVREMTTGSGGTVVASAEWPNSETGDVNTPPSTISWNATDPTTVTEAITSSGGAQQSEAVTPGWTQTCYSTISATTAYTLQGLQNYMTTNGMTLPLNPAELVITLPSAPNIDYKVQSSATDGNSGSYETASAIQADIARGK